MVDFGLVKYDRPESPTNPALSTVNAIMGTPLYLSPEAIAQPAAIDARSDLFSLGVVMYEMLTTRRLYEGGSTENVARRMDSRDVDQVALLARLQREAGADAAEMLDLVARTDPGPFRKRAVELGRYLGIRRDGQLVAMAGERLRFAAELHDIQGHSLQVIALKSELAARLVGTDASRAVAEMREIEALARQALRDTRE